MSNLEEKLPSENEGIKEASNYLRGTIAEALNDDSTGSIPDDDIQLTKFHGTYIQDDRDLRKERRKAKLERAYSFMIRVRMPGGVCQPDQWLKLDELSDKYANGTVKLTTRQTIQYHGVIKSNLKASMQGINESLFDTIAACGDVNRNVLSTSNPYESELHAEVFEASKKISEHLLPQTRAYHEIWLDEEKVQSTEEEIEPLYGKHYLPRKFKIVMAIPPSNDVDIFAHDLGFIAIVENAKIIGYNVTVGGGMGMAHKNEATFPRLADVIGFCTPEQLIDVAEKVMLVQRDFGDRSDRKHARLKYTIEDRGVEWFRNELESRLTFKLSEAKDFSFESTGDRFGWVKGYDGNEHLTLFIQGGRLRDNKEFQYRTALREIAKVHDGEFRLTANQNIIIAKVKPDAKASIEAILLKYGIDANKQYTGLRRNSMSCVSLPTCGLGLAESERYLPDLMTGIEEVLDQVGLSDDDIIIRMTGCPNGCARPYLAEIGFVGRAPRKYNMYLGAAFNGTRLNKLYKESVKDEDIVNELKPLLEHYAKERLDGERFGDFVIRKDYVKATTHGNNFHK